MIEREDQGEIAVLRLAHGRVSAMDLELCVAVAEQLRALADDPARAVVVTGTGKAFSAGVDLRRIVDGAAAYVREFLPALSEMFRAAFELPKPLVAAVNGHAIAGGCVLAATADTVLMAEGNGRIGVPEIRVGVAFPRVPLEVMRFAVGEVAARRLILGAQTHAPADAQALGLVDDVVPADGLVARALEVAREMTAAVPADTFALTKAQMRRDAVERMAAHPDDEERVEQIWVDRATDGWLERYLESVTKR